MDQTGLPLTFDASRVIDDPRFSIVRPYIKDWNLMVEDVRWKDSGQYMCTVNTEPVLTYIVTLHVTGQFKSLFG